MNGTTYGEGRFGIDLHDPGTHAFRAIFAFYDGQDFDAIPLIACPGFFGGSFVYNHVICMTLMNSSSTTYARRRGVVPSHRSIAYNKFGGFGSSPQRFVNLNCLDGHLYLSDAIAAQRRREKVISLSSKDDPYDAGLVWMEEYAHKLENGHFEIARTNPEPETPLKMISHHPSFNCQERLSIGNDSIPVVSRAVTKGIEVIASSNWDPLLPDHISYSIRIRLLTPGEEGYMTPTERGFHSCQLLSRHWTFQSRETGEEENVDGTGVIGLYPVLFENQHRVDSDGYGGIEKGVIHNEGTFRYASYSSSSCNKFWGRIRFVPGSIASPEGGEAFFVVLAPFALISDERRRNIY